MSKIKLQNIPNNNIVREQDPGDEPIVPDDSGVVDDSGNIDDSGCFDIEAGSAIYTTGIEGIKLNFLIKWTDGNLTRAPFVSVRILSDFLDDPDASGFMGMPYEVTDPDHYDYISHSVNEYGLIDNGVVVGSSLVTYWHYPCSKSWVLGTECMPRRRYGSCPINFSIPRPTHEDD